MEIMPMIGNDHLRARAARRRLGRLLACSLTLLFALFGALAGSGAPSPVHAAGAQATWSQLHPTTSPSARADASMAYDPATHQMLLFGGSDNTAAGDLNDTWSWDGGTWHQLNPATSPPNLADASMAYDPATRQLLLFGGYDGHSAARSDTWSWDGSTWTQLSPAVRPPARSAATMAFDQNSGRLILFGGASSTNAPLQDTWSWDGSTWTQLSPATSPPAREFASMDYDPVSGKLLLFGGANGDVRGGVPTNLGDTWAWNGTTWQQLTPAGNPSALYGASMAYDPATGYVVLYGGFDGNLISGSQWKWDGSTWSRISGFWPYSRELASMAYDQATGQLLLFGGFGTVNGSPVDFLGDTWAYGATLSWNKLSPAASPSARWAASMAYDPATRQFLLFGGADSGGNALEDTWSWDGSTWHQLCSPCDPPALRGASMAYDPATHQFLLFGGANSTGVSQETWTWDGSKWSQLSPSSSPDPRSFASMAYDPASGKLLLFGGLGFGTTHLGDTWAWDGSTWSKLCSTCGPSVRDRASMAYDPASGQLILFGGASPGNILPDIPQGDTWAWDGSTSTWSKLSPSSSPPNQMDDGMAFDPASGQLILTGGQGDTWGWDGSTWSQLYPATEPPTYLFNPSMEYDPATRQILLFGGNDGTNVHADTWSWQFGPTIPNPSPAISGLTPASVTAGGTGLTLQVHGSGFVAGVSQVDWNGSALSGATYASNGTPVTSGLADEIDVPVPGSDLTAPTIDHVTVVNPAPGGGTSGLQVFYVTRAGVTVTASNQATSTSASGTATASVGGTGPGATGGLSATGSGQGTVAVAQYSTDPETSAPGGAVNAYFDLYVPASSSFTTLTVTDCNLAGGSKFYYWNGSSWVAVSGQTYDPATGCATFTLTGSSTPNIIQLSGTGFGVVNVPPVVADPGAQSAQYGQPLSFNVTATDVEPGDTVTLSASGLPAGLSLGPTTFNSTTKQWTATVSGTVSAPVGPYTASITANDGFSTSAVQTVTINITQAATSTSLSSSANPSILNQGVSFTANVAAVAAAAGTPTGSVQFQIDGANFGSPVTLSGGKATSASIATLAVGSHTIAAVYSGAANFSGSTGTLTQQVTYQIKALYDQTGRNTSGAGVPIKVQLLNYTGKNLSSSNIVLTLGTPAVAPSPSPGAQPSGTFTFMSTGDAGPMYQYNVKTTGYPKGTYTLSFTATGDPVTHAVQFVIG